jgi:hypothetical protein
LSPKKPHIVSSPSPSTNRNIQQRIATSPVSNTERVLYSPADPNRPRELANVESRLRSPRDYEELLPSSFLGDASFSSPERGTDKEPEVLREAASEELNEVVDGFDVVLRLEDALDDVSRELMLYEERTEQAIRVC